MAIAAAALAVLAVLAATISPSLAYPVIGGSPERLLVTGEQSGGEFSRCSRPRATESTSSVLA